MSIRNHFNALSLPCDFCTVDKARGEAYVKFRERGDVCDDVRATGICILLLSTFVLSTYVVGSRSLTWCPFNTPTPPRSAPHNAHHLLSTGERFRDTTSHCSSQTLKPTTPCLLLPLNIIPMSLRSVGLLISAGGDAVGLSLLQVSPLTRSQQMSHDWCCQSADQ